MSSSRRRCAAYDRARYRLLQGPEVGKIPPRICPHVLPVAEKNDREIVFRNSGYVGASETGVGEATTREVRRRLPAKEVLVFVESQKLVNCQGSNELMSTG